MRLELALRPCGLSSAVGHFLEVENLQPRAEAFPHNFTVCISAMFEFSNVLQVGSCSPAWAAPSRVRVAPADLCASLQLVQSFEMLSLLGATRVVVYKTSASPETQQVLDYYTQKGTARRSCRGPGAREGDARPVQQVSPR